MRHRTRRVPSDLMVRLNLAEDEVTAKVCNVTRTGLQLRGIFDAEEGDMVRIGLRDRQFRGRLVWKTDIAAGVVFDAPITDADVAFFTGKRGQHSTRGRGRVGFGS